MDQTSDYANFLVHEALGWGLVASGNNLMITELDFQPTPILQGMGKVEMQFKHATNDLINHACIIKSPGDEAWQASQLVNISMY